MNCFINLIRFVKVIQLNHLIPKQRFEDFTIWYHTITKPFGRNISTLLTTHDIHNLSNSPKTVLFTIQQNLNFDNCLYVLFKSYQNVSLLLKFVPFKSSLKISTTNLGTPIPGKCKKRSPKVSGSQRIFTYVDGSRDSISAFQLKRNCPTVSARYRYTRMRYENRRVAAYRSRWPQWWQKTERSHDSA